MIVPSLDRSPESGPRVVHPDEIFLSAPVGYAAAARMRGDAVVQIIGRNFAFAQDETLPIAALRGPNSSTIPADAAIFCGRPNSKVARDMIAASTLGISSLFNQTTGQTRVCFIDRERDERAEEALLVGIKDKENGAPIAISPVGYELVKASPMSGESKISLIYRGKTGLTGGHVSFDLLVVEQGNQLIFENTRRKVDIKDLPQRVTLMGAEFTVQAYDKDTDAVTVEVHKGFPAASYGLHTTYTTTYIPIYVPR